MDYLKLNGQVVNLQIKGETMLTKKQKKLPPALQKAILKKQKKKKKARK